LIAIRSGLVDFGMTTTSCSMCQRITTCAGVTPCASAMRTSRGSRSRIVFSGL
jgi:sulfite reductase beta subunit-like hemoprotein